MSQLTGSSLFVIKIKSLSAAKSAAVFATFSIVKVVESSIQIISFVAVKTGFDKYALLSVLELLTQPSSSTNSA